MILWKAKKEVDCAKVREQVSKGYGIEHPERIQGFYGYFLSGNDDIWVDEAVAEKMKTDENFERELENCVKKFYNDEYGEISKSDYDNNIENKYAFGCYDIVGKYTLTDCRVQVYNSYWHTLEIMFLPPKEKLRKYKSS